MLTVILSGGLGNQMFQYAAGRALSLRLGVPLSVELYKLTKKTAAVKRDYELNIFNVPIKIEQSLKSKLIVKSYRYLTNNQIGNEIIRKLNVVSDNDYSNILTDCNEIGRNAILFGYFQNEKYFRSYEDQIRQDFTFKNKLDERNENIAEQMHLSNSVSLHIRRGDYTHSGSNLIVQDISYYRNAIEHIAQRVKCPVFFIFSDDMEWVKNNLEMNDFQHNFIDWNTGNKSYIDMQLISCCKHNIIANSSFSWWGAWLNPNSEKIVLAPSVWYKVQDKVYPEGFIPERWTILSNKQ